MNDQTKLPMMLSTVSKAFGKGTPAAIGAAAQLLETLRLGLIYKDITKPSQVSKEFLVGGRQKAGSAQVVSSA